MHLLTIFRWRRFLPYAIHTDFNFQPDDPAYSMLVGDPLLPGQEARLELSRVVHVSIDPDVPVSAPSMNDDEEGAETGETDPDRIITNARLAGPEDGLLTNAELVEISRAAGKVKSAYDEGLRGREGGEEEKGLTFGSRVTVPSNRRGAHEPVWTSYTHVSASFRPLHPRS